MIQKLYKILMLSFTNPIKALKLEWALKKIQKLVFMQIQLKQWLPTTMRITLIKSLI